jgi:hypothetical protein
MAADRGEPRPAISAVHNVLPIDDSATVVGALTYKRYLSWVQRRAVDRTAAFEPALAQAIVREQGTLIEIQLSPQILTTSPTLDEIRQEGIARKASLAADFVLGVYEWWGVLRSALKTAWLLARRTKLSPPENINKINNLINNSDSVSTHKFTSFDRRRG